MSDFDSRLYSLILLYKSCKKISVGGLSRLLGVSRYTVYSGLQDLEKLGYLLRVGRHSWYLRR